MLTVNPSVEKFPMFKRGLMNPAIIEIVLRWSCYLEVLRNSKSGLYEWVFWIRATSIDSYGCGHMPCVSLRCVGLMVDLLCVCVFAYFGSLSWIYKKRDKRFLPSGR